MHQLPLCEEAPNPRRGAKVCYYRRKKERASWSFEFLCDPVQRQEIEDSAKLNDGATSYNQHARGTAK